MKNIIILSQILTIFSFSMYAIGPDFASKEDEQEWLLKWEEANKITLRLCDLEEIKEANIEDERQRLTADLNEKFDIIKNKKIDLFKLIEPVIIGTRYVDLQRKHSSNNFKPLIMYPIISYLKIFKKYPDYISKISREVVMRYIQSVIRHNLELFCTSNIEDYYELYGMVVYIEFLPEEWVLDILHILHKNRVFLRKVIAPELIHSVSTTQGREV